MSHAIRGLLEFAKKNPLTPKELAAEQKRLMKFGASQAKRLGIITDADIVRIIHESRARRSAASRR